MIHKNVYFEIHKNVYKKYTKMCTKIHNFCVYKCPQFCVHKCPQFCVDRCPQFCGITRHIFVDICIVHILWTKCTQFWGTYTSMWTKMWTFCTQFLRECIGLWKPPRRHWREQAHAATQISRSVMCHTLEALSLTPMYEWQLGPNKV